jgi:hypothetical protein
VKLINVCHKLFLDVRYVNNISSVQTFGTLKFTTAAASVNDTDDRQGSSNKRKILCVKIFEIKDTLIIRAHYSSNCIPETILVGKSCRKRQFLRNMGKYIKVNGVCIYKTGSNFKNKVQ